MSDAVIDRIKTEHWPEDRADGRVCSGCKTAWPCPTARFLMDHCALEADVARLTEDGDHYRAAMDTADTVIDEMSARYRQAAGEIVRLRADNAALRAVLARLVEAEDFACDPVNGGCMNHDFEQPCPVAEARRLLDREGAT